MLITIIMEKIPEELRLLITRNFNNAEWDVTQLLEEFKKELSVREKCDIKPRTNTNASEKQLNERVGSATALLSQKQTRISCMFCKGDHYSDKCTVVTNITTRREFLRRSGKCFNCLKPGHMARNCEKEKVCFYCKEKGHNSALCERKEGDSQDKVKQTIQSYVSTCNNRILLQTAEANVYDDSLNNVLKVRVLFDTGSQKSYVSQRVQNILRLKTIEHETLSILTFGTTQASPRTLEKIQLNLSNVSTNENVAVDALAIPYICAPITEQPITFAKNKYAHLQRLQLADSGDSKLEIDVLIGADNYWKFFTGEISNGPPSTPTASNSKLGWVLSGPVPPESNQNTTNATVTHFMKIDTRQSSQLQQIEENLSKFWDLESLGIDQNESSTIEKLVKNIEMNHEDRYEVTLPFKEDHPTIHDNYELSRDRLTKLHKRLLKDEKLFKEYNAVFREQLEKGVIERADDPGEVGATHYLPHHPVIKEERNTTKLRVVFDASSKLQGPSLNDCLYKGPQLTPLLYDILVRFRSYPVALTADIEKAFLQISIKENDRDYLRFLWLDDINKEKPSIVQYRFKRVVFGVNSSPFLLNGTLRKHTEQYIDDEDFVTKTCDSLYVDDVSGGDEDQDASMHYTKLKTRFQTANFNFRKWRTNDDELRSLISNDDKTHAPEKILGVKWDEFEDTLIFDLQEICNISTSSTITKRTMLKTLASFFDPLGLLQPIVVGLKILFQEACKHTKDWDETLPQQLQERWNERIQELDELQIVDVQRPYITNDAADPVVSYELHGYSDASSDAYGACVYLKATSISGNIQTALISSKSKVAPIKTMTIPRLELLGNLLLARLTKTVVEALKHRYNFKRITYWTDSMASLAWIKSTKELQTFVENRVQEIRKLTIKENWFHIKGRDNPADLITRNTTVHQFNNNKLWWNGSDEIHLNSKDVNELNINSIILPAPNEVKKQTNNLLAPTATYEPITDIERFSSLKKLYRTTAYVMRFVNNLKARINENVNSRNDEISATELNTAEHYWVKVAQTNLHVPKQVSSFQDENGVLRFQGRLGNAPIPLTARHPILLPSHHRLTELIVLDTHQNVKHAWVKDTLTELRQRYWVTKGRSFVRKLLFKCRRCRKHHAKPYDYPKSPPLTSLRTQDSRAFVVTGIDNFGPIHVKDVYSRRSRTYKSWATLYTCASSRAIVLDLVTQPSAPEFHASFRRFIARRGCPDHVITDNGSNFTAKDTQRFATDRNITWHLNVPLAPWYGGFFERIIKIVKSLLKKTLSTDTYTYDEIQTFLLEIEQIVNNRPITYMYGDEVEPCLTPNHLTFGRRLETRSNNTLTQLPTNTDPPLHDQLETALSRFWDKWRTEYLTELREHQRNSTKKQISTPKINDVVIVQEDYTPRSFWRVAVVTEVHRGKDGFCRSASLKLGDTRNVITRPISKLFPIERYDEQDRNNEVNTNIQDNKACETQTNDTNTNTRHKRNAAVIADLKLRFQN